MIKEQNTTDEVHQKYFYDFITSNFSLKFAQQYANKEEGELQTNIISILEAGIKEKQNKQCLNLSFISLSKENISTLLSNLDDKNNIESLILASNNDLSLDGLMSTTKKISQISCFKKFFTYNTKLAESHLSQPIIELTKNSKSLTHLLISTDNLGDSGIISLVNEGLLLNSSLLELSLTNVNMTYVGLEAIGKFLIQNSSLKILSIASSDLSYPNSNVRPINLDVEASTKVENPDSNNCVFLKGLTTNQSLEKLHLVSAKLESESVNIVKAFSLNQTSKLVYLNLTDNGIKALDFKSILENLTSTKLQTLNLNSNEISDLGMYYLDDYLSNTYPFNTKNNNFQEKIHFMELEQNSITDKGAKQLISSIDSGYFYFTKLNIGYNIISLEQIKRIAASLVVFSKSNEEKSSRNYDNIFKFLNIGQYSIDLIRNSNVSDEDYELHYSSVIEAEYNRFFLVNI